MKQSAVQWLVNVVQSCIAPNYIPKEIVEQAREMEKQQQGYSEKDMKSAFKVGFSIGYERDVHAINENNRICKEWFEQFKNK